MAFPGSIPQSVQQMLAEHVAGWPVREVFVGCSGNFTAERVLHDLPLTFHGNDVLLYSTALGAHFAGSDVAWQPTDETLETWPWLEKDGWFDGDRLHRLASLMQSYQLAVVEGRTENAYYARLAEATVEQWPTNHAETLRRLKEVDVRLGSFTAMDVLPWVESLPVGSAVIAYPPFLDRQAAYDRYFTKMEELYDWERPAYELLDHDRLVELFETMASKRHWAFATNWPVPGFDGNLRGLAKTTNRAPTLHVYASQGAKRLIAPRQPVEDVGVPRLSPDEDMGERLSIAPLTYGQFCALRSKYMNPGIRPGQASLSLAVLVDGKLVGAFAYSTSPSPATFAEHLPQPKTYLLSDFPVAPSKYKRLSKLVLYAALSKECKLLVERYSNRRWRSVSTTALSKSPVSMKYRGMWKLIRRQEFDLDEKAWSTEIDRGNSYYRRPYELEYGSELGRWTLEEGLSEWKAKHAATAS